jgi:hypothetical protein
MSRIEEDKPMSSWKVVVDTGNSDAPPAPSAAAKP